MMLHCNGRTCDNIYLITIKVGHLSPHTVAPSILPSLEAPAQGFFCYLPEFGRGIGSDIVRGCETFYFEANFQKKEQSKVTQSEMRML